MSAVLHVLEVGCKKLDSLFKLCFQELFQL